MQFRNHYFATLTELGNNRPTSSVISIWYFLGGSTYLRLCILPKRWYSEIYTLSDITAVKVRKHRMSETSLDTPCLKQNGRTYDNSVFFSFANASWTNDAMCQCRRDTVDISSQ